MNNATRFLNLAFRILAEVSCTYDQRDFWDSAFAEDLAVTESKEIEDGCAVFGGFSGEVFLALFNWYKRPQLRISVSRRRLCLGSEVNYLVEIDHRLPELILQLVKISHADLSEVTRMVLVEIRSVMMRSTGHTATTGMLPVLADTTSTGGDMTATVKKWLVFAQIPFSLGETMIIAALRGDILFPRFAVSGRHCDKLGATMQVLSFVEEVRAGLQMCGCAMRQAKVLALTIRIT